METNTAMFPTTSKIDAILGADIINQFYWDFNFDKKEITISKKIIKKDFSLKIPFTIDEKSSLYYVDIAIDGKKTDAILDFGNNSDYIFMKSNIATSLFTNNPPYVTLEGMGPIGVSGVQEKAVSYLLKNNYNFTLGQAEINQEQTPYINITNNLFYNTVIGNQIIKNLGNIVIDPFSKFIGVYPSNKVNESYTFTNFGIAPALIQDKIIIALIVPESKNVKTNNFLAGDVIKSVDGHTADFFKTQNELSNYFTENKKITIVTKEDKTVVLNQEVIL